MFTDSAASVSPAFEDVLPEEPRTTAKRREICQSFQHGKCRLGAACPERHVLSQFKTMRLEVCKHWLRGACVNGENCLYLHAYDDRYVPSCAFYQRLGECTNPECPFQHVAQAQQQQQPECAAYRRGFCPRGPQCHLRHVWREACVYYLAGFCPLGARCPAGHPVQELYNRNAVAERLRQRMLIERADDPTFNKNATCYRCFDPGHLAPKCPGVQNGILRRLLLAVQEPGEQLYFQSDGRSTRKCCFFCGEEGHEVRDCPKKSKSHQGNAWHKNRRGDMAGR
ncbi:zinc finger protein [Trypanosoma melophagium]|uniref:zinc finger protein n=1 Tax=Trypanosoma melophagium TaxID=715481 RepID=UPI00351AACDC|nr:zinc finger protein [Trypanosoma melophagium]